MVAIATAVGRSGFQEWVIQRVTAVIMALYVVVMIVFLCLHSDLDYNTWLFWFECSLVKCATLLTLLAVVTHSWIGIWTITTDYVKHVFIRLPLQMIINLSLLVYVIWGIQILWGV